AQHLRAQGLDLRVEGAGRIGAVCVLVADSTPGDDAGDQRPLQGAMQALPVGAQRDLQLTQGQLVVGPVGEVREQAREGLRPPEGDGDVVHRQTIPLRLALPNTWMGLPNGYRVEREHGSINVPTPDGPTADNEPRRKSPKPGVSPGPGPSSPARWRPPPPPSP